MGDMRVAWWTLGMLAVGLAACSSPARPARRPTRPAFARVYLVGVTVAPNKYDGTPWDGPGRVAPDIVHAIAVALGAPDAFAAVLATLGRPAIAALEKPETRGRATLLTSKGASPPLPLLAQRDAFTPQWQGTPSFGHVPLDGSTRVHVELLDNDIAFDDPMGAFDLNAADLLAAIRVGRVFHVRVAEQTNKQILFAAVSVIPE